MTQTFAAVKGRLGSTDYYTILLRGADIANMVRTAQEVEDWDNLSIEEKYQRKINDTRIKKQVAVYFANDRDRFTGSIILAMKGGSDDMRFVPVSDKIDIDPSYQAEAKDMGFLIFSGAQILVPIDGQHRARAIKYAIDGKDGEGKNIEGIKPTPELAKEKFVVIVFEFNTKKAREIFNKTNQYARPTVKGQNLITDDDDIVAFISREITKPEYKLFDSRVVQIDSSSLAENAKEFIPLSTLYDINRIILEERAKEVIDIKKRPDIHKEKYYKEEIISVWKELLKGFELFTEALKDKSSAGENQRINLRKAYVCNKPVGQRALITALMKMERGNGDLQGSIKKLNKLNWSVKNNIWQGVLMQGERVMSPKNAKHVPDFIRYLAGDKMTEKELEDLTESIKGKRVEGDDYKLPKL